MRAAGGAASPAGCVPSIELQSRTEEVLVDRWLSGGRGEPHDEPRVPIPRVGPDDWVPPEIEDQEDDDPVVLARRILAEHEVDRCGYCYDNGDCRVRFWADDTVRGAES